MLRWIVCLCAPLFLLACGTKQQSDIDLDAELSISNRTLYTPHSFDFFWVLSARKSIREGKVHTIVCSTVGGDAVGAIALADELQSGGRPIRVVVPAGHSCVSAGALIWFAAPYRMAEGDGAPGVGSPVALHSPRRVRDKKLMPDLNLIFAQILANSGASPAIQAKLLVGLPDRLFPLSPEELRQSFKNP